MATPTWVRETLAALGGNKALVMMGAKNVGYSEQDHTVTMKLPRNASGANYLIIKLTNRDLYDLELQSIRKVKGRYKQTLKARVEGVYADGVRPWVEHQTGMYLSLGTMGRNPRRKTKIRKLSPNTQHVVEVMLESMRQLPDSPFHPSTFTYTMRGYRGNIAPAIRYLKEMGMIEIAGYNYDNQPLYKPSKAFLEAAKTKKNPTPKNTPWAGFWHEGHRNYIRYVRGKELFVGRGDDSYWYAQLNQVDKGRFRTLKEAQRHLMKITKR